MIFAVPMWGSEVAKSKTESYIRDVTTIEREGDFTSLGIWYCDIYISILLYLLLATR